MHTRAGGPVPAISLSTELPETVLEALREEHTPQPQIGTTPGQAASPTRQPSKSTSKRCKPVGQEVKRGVAEETPPVAASQKAAASADGDVEGKPSTRVINRRSNAGRSAGQEVGEVSFRGARQKSGAGAAVEGGAASVARKSRGRVAGEASSPSARQRTGTRAAVKAGAAAVATREGERTAGVLGGPGSDEESDAGAQESLRPTLDADLRREHGRIPKAERHAMTSGGCVC